MTAAKPAVLIVEGLNAWYGPAQALFDVGFSVKAGELVVLQGLNGAGKSTLLQALIGIGPRVQGQIVWDGEPLQGWPAHRRARAGLGFVAEDRRLFTALSVRENLWIAARAGEHGSAATQFDKVLALFPSLQAMLEQAARRLVLADREARRLWDGPELLDRAKKINAHLIDNPRGASDATRRRWKEWRDNNLPASRTE